MYEEEEQEEDEEDGEERKSSSKKKKKSVTKSKRRSGGAAASDSARAKLLSSTHRMLNVYIAQLDLIFAYTDASAPDVKDAVFRILSDAFIAFSGKVTTTLTCNTRAKDT